MKTKFSVLILLQLFIVYGTFSQQKFSFKCGGSACDFSYDSPSSQAGFTLASGIVFKVIVADVSKISKIEFQDSHLSPVISLNNTQLLTLNSQGIITLNIGTNKKIISFENAGEVPYPFNIVVTYNNVKSPSGLIGNASVNTDMENQNGNGLSDKNIYTGIAYYDAITISNLIKQNEYSCLYDFMHTYYFTSSSTLTKDELITASNGNDYFKDIFQNNINGAGIACPHSGFSSLALSSIGNLDVTNLADGFAKFLVKRTKEELSVTFFDRFNKFISDDKYKDARILFPQTYATLQAIGDQIYNYKAYINSLRESFEKDLNGLLPNLKEVINNGRYADFFTAHPDLKAVCLSSIDIGNGLINKQQPGEIIATYDVSQLDVLSNKNIKAAVQILQLFSKSLRSLSKDHYWIPADSVELLIKDDLAFKIYLGLIYQQAGDKNIIIQDVAGVSNFQDVLKNSAAKISAFDKYIREFIGQAEIVVTSIKNISGKESDKLTFTDYYGFYNSSLDLMQKASSVYELPGLSSLKPSDDFIKYENIARAGGNIALDINRKNYSSAVINVYSLYSYAFGGSENNIKKISTDKTKTSTEQTDATKLLTDRKT